MAEQKTREIKFRAWDTVNKRMVDLHKLTPLALVEGINTSGKGLYLPLGEDTLIFEQYTGLKDKNGREIFEGDIIEYENGNAGYGRPREQEISRDVIPSILDHYTHEDMKMWWENGEIIGNIHENPELLKENNNG